MTEISLEEAKAIAERLEKANAENKQLVERLEKLRTLDILGGRSSASEPKPVISEQDKLKQDSKDFFKGSEIEVALNKYG
jgi:hypothetical protein